MESNLDVEEDAVSGGGGSSPSSSSPASDTDTSSIGTPSHPRRTNQQELQRQWEVLLKDQLQTAAGRRIIGITTTNTITTTYKEGGRLQVTRNFTGVRNCERRFLC